MTQPTDSYEPEQRNGRYQCPRCLEWTLNTMSGTQDVEFSCSRDEAECGFHEQVPFTIFEGTSDFLATCRLRERHRRLDSANRRYFSGATVRPWCEADNCLRRASFRARQRDGEWQVFCARDVRPLIEVSPLADLEVQTLNGKPVVALTLANDVRAAVNGQSQTLPKDEPCLACGDRALVERGDPPVLYDCDECMPRRIAANNGLHPFRHAL